MRRIAKPVALILMLSVFCLFQAKPVLSQTFKPKLTQASPTIHTSPEKDFAKQVSKSRKWLWWGLACVAVCGVAAAAALGAGGSSSSDPDSDPGPGSGSDQPTTGGVSASW
jgi:hypothetical protein